MQNMPIQTLKSYRIGQIVRIMGREGTISNMAGSEVKIKFSDGTFAFFNVDQLESSVDGGSMDSRIKSISKSFGKECPFCKGDSFKVGMDFEQKETGAYQCMKCSQRFISEAQIKSSNIYADFMPRDETSTQILM